MASMGDIALLILIFIMIIVLAILFTLSYFKLGALPPPSSLSPDPNTVYCSEDDVLQAWIMGYSNRESCPEFTNNFVVNNDYNLYEKYFLVDPTSQCCWYSNDADQRTLISEPWVCNGYMYKPTPNELNLKPYWYNGQAILYINPTCDDDPDCISMVRAGVADGTTATANGITGSPIGVYKLTKFHTESSETWYGEAVPPPDSSADYAQRLNFYISDSCSTLLKITLDGDTVMELVIGTDNQPEYVWYDNPALRPDIVTSVYEYFVRDRFYPIAGANPILSEYAAGYL